MALEDDIKNCLKKGNTVVLTIRYNPGVNYTGVVGEVNDETFVLLGEIVNQFEYYSNISADPIYRTHEFDIADIASIRIPLP